MGVEDKVPVRLVALPLTEKLANKRRRKAKNNRDKRLNHDTDYLFLLGWTIYITNVPSSIWNSQEAAEAYSFRWRIVPQLRDKNWKSNLKISEAPDTSEHMVKIFILIHLFMITLFHSFFWSNIHQKNLMSENTHISILRVTRFIFRNLWIILSQLENENVEFLYDLIEYHCKYEKRNKRKNYAQKRINLS